VSERYRIEEAWDTTLGMRATRSDDTILDGAFVPDRYVSRVLPVRALDLFILSVFGYAEPAFAAI
jgi:alkylation response protein AidB-like acyl-CoA dehydrogenase